MNFFRAKAEILKKKKKKKKEKSVDNGGQFFFWCTLIQLFQWDRSIRIIVLLARFIGVYQFHPANDKKRTPTKHETECFRRLATFK